MKIIALISFILVLSSIPLKAQQVETDSSAVDSADAALEAELAKMLVEDKSSSKQVLQPRVQIPTVSVGGFSNMNPNIGLITKFTGDALAIGEIEIDEEEGSPEGFNFHEVELSFQMVIDPYARADFFIAFLPEEEAVELEEAFITVFSLPFDLRAKAGIIRTKLGRLNPIHPPEVVFVDYPLPLEMYFGGEGLVGTGVSVSYLIPNKWDLFWEATFEVTNGDNEMIFNGNSTNDLAYNGHFSSFFNLGDNSALLLGGTAMSGVNDELGLNRTNVYGIDITYKWRPLRRQLYKSFTWQTEFFFLDREEGTPENIKAAGFYSYMEYQLGRRWFVLGRYDRAELTDNSGNASEKYVAALTYFPSNFQTIRLQSTTSKDFTGESSTLLSLQWNFVIGAHGAHIY
ncbi:MAG: hypothetical protein IH825_00950 [Candidatus Marinimicrobia bacterium]|nr:hypothetical protein [Candidatus Neomarinimicrobiota bacterium]